MIFQKVRNLRGQRPTGEGKNTGFAQTWTEIAHLV